MMQALLHFFLAFTLEPLYCCCMQPKPRYVAKFRSARGRTFFLYLRAGQQAAGGIAFNSVSCTKDNYQKSSLPAFDGISTRFELPVPAYSPGLDLNAIANLYREGKVTEEAVTIAMEILL